MGVKPMRCSKRVCEKAATGDPVALRCLMEGLQHDDNQKVFAQFYSTYFPLVVSTCQKYLDNVDDAVDTAQEVFICAYISFETVCEPRAFNAWIMKIAHLCSMKNNRQRECFLKPFTEEVLTPSSTFMAVGHEELFERSELERTLYCNIANLPFSQRKILYLRYLESLSPIEIAEMLNFKPGTVRKSLFDARGALRKKLKKLGHSL